ncbi:hypothetical protein B0H13DRAFT_2491700 [Mycena leptocephala]|nr:hypothetical protein B0H13DRAFT_2491700 [Mycena leptocephala]
MTNDLPLYSVGRNHTDVYHPPPSSLPGKPTKLTLNLAVQIEYALNSEDIEFKVYTPMDVDDLPVNVDESRICTPMDVDETCVTDSSGPEAYSHISTDGSHQTDNTSVGTKESGILALDSHYASNYPGMFARIDGVSKLTDYQTKSPSSTSNQTFLAHSNLGQDLLQQEWESWDSGTLQDQKLMYKKKWKIMRHTKQPFFPFQFRHIPWPIFRSGDRYPEISTPSVEWFIFGETLGRSPTKESKRLAKENLRLFHADKFDLVLRRVLPSERERARHGAEAVCRVLTRHIN